MRNLSTTFGMLILAIVTFNVSLAAERREVAPAAIFGAPQNSAQRAGVEKLLEDFKESWASQNVDAHIKLFAADAEWINAYARMFRGTDELEVFLREQLFPAFDSRVSQEEIRNANLISTRYLGDDAAVLHLYTDGPRGPSTIPGRELRRTHLHLVFAKQGDEWKIVHTAIMDARN